MVICDTRGRFRLRQKNGVSSVVLTAGLAIYFGKRGYISRLSMTKC